MKKKELRGKRGKGKFALVDDSDFEQLNQYKWYLNNHGYPVTTIRLNGKQRNVLLPRLIMNPPAKMEVDHKNGDPLDNQRINLRICTHKQNCWNRTKQTRTSSSKYKGVHYINMRYYKRKWRASIRINDTPLLLGDFATEIEAAKAYNEAAIKYHGEFANLNSFK